MEKLEDCVIDNLVIYVYEVRVNAFEYFREKLDKAELEGKIPNVRFTIGKGYSEYHYRLNVGQGSGAVTIGYKHNSVRHIEEFFTMRVEFNPSKNEKLYRGFWDVFRELFVNHVKKIKQLDLAFDVPIEINRLFAISLTGRQRSYYKNTQYFGSPGNTGRLKIYDKKNELEEKQGVKVLEEHRTWIEYTIRFEDAVTVQLLSKLQVSLNDDYTIAVLNVEKLTGEIKAAVLGVHHGYMKMNEFTRTTKVKIKKALDSMGQLDLNHAYQNALDRNVKMISSYFKL